MNRRTLLARLAGLGGSVAAGALLVKAEAPATLEPTANNPPDLGPFEAVKWPCMGCLAENSTPLILWPTLKFHLHCEQCGGKQLYRMHLYKFDPNPTDYSKAKPLTPYQLMQESPRPLGSFQHDRVEWARETREAATLRRKNLIRRRLMTKKSPLPLPV